MNINARIPVIPLDYSERHKACPKELMVDYETGNIYVVSSTDKTIIHDITSKIKEKIDSLDGGKIDILIEGIGKVSLNDILSQLRNEIEGSVQLLDTEDVNYVGRENVPDNISVEFNERNLQMKDFNSAPNLSIPRKKDGKIEWIDQESLVGCNYTTTGDGYSENNGGIIKPGNPNDGKILYCFDLVPLNGKIFLRASKRQKSIYITEDCKVILPKTLDEYSEIEWYVVTNSFAPTFKFTNNLIWRNPNIQPDENSHHIYIFKTWDYGRTWLAELISYDGTKSIHNTVDITYLENNYYNKKEIQKEYYNKSNSDDKYITKDNLKDEYITKSEIKENYNTKQEIKDMLSWKPKPKKEGEK